MLTSCADLHVKEFKNGKFTKQTTTDGPTQDQLENAQIHIENVCNKDSTLTGLVLYGEDTILLISPQYTFIRK